MLTASVTFLLFNRDHGLNVTFRLGRHTAAWRAVGRVALGPREKLENAHPWQALAGRYSELLRAAGHQS